MAGPASTYVAEPYSYAAVRRLVAELGVSEPVAVTLVRRGFGDPEEARRFLDASESHDPREFDSMLEAGDRVLAAIEVGRRITVHGDFDVDGVCATAILVSTLRLLGADCDWYIPDRLADGYGLRAETVERLAARGTGLLLTADCGITAADEVRRARQAGMDVIVTDHHAPAAELPPCTIVHPRVSGYPFAELCGAAVAHKLAAELLRRRGLPGEADAQLDLVALATVADVVPLLGENRALVRRGLAVARRARRPGLAALLAVCGSDPQRLDEGDFAFRLAPRINAAGRLYRADAGVELFLTRERERADRIAAELDRANRERQAAEREVEAAAEAARRALPEELREAPALVLAGEGWHPGVIGIVASRLAERHWRPVVVISLDGEGGRGSARSVPGFDLLSALDACAGRLRRHGGHAAAAGLELDAAEVEGFRADFVACVRERVGAGGHPRSVRVDALVGGTALGLPLAEELERLAPFGAGNPGVRLLVPSARVSDVRPMGEGKHSRFSLASGGNRALAVAFGRSSLGVREEDPVDASVRLEVNRWNGSLEPRLVLQDLHALRDDGEPEAHHACACEDEEWWLRVEAQLAPEPPEAGEEPAGAARQEVAHAGSVVSVLAELVSSGEPVLAVCADASRRAALAAGAAGLARFAGRRATVACGGCADAAARAALAGSGFALVDYEVLERHRPQDGCPTHVVLVDPAPSAALAAAAAAGEGFVHSPWGEAERKFARQALAARHDLDPHLRAIYAALRDRPGRSGGELRELLAGGGRHPRHPELVGRCLRVLLETGLCERDADLAVGGVRVVSSQRIELSHSAAYRARRAWLEEARTYLATGTSP